MSISTVNVISERIKSAKQHSPIVVVSVKRRTGTIYNAFFDNTAFTRNLTKDGGYLGSFYGHTGVAEFKSKIKGDYL